MITDRSRFLIFLVMAMFMASMVVGVSPAYGKSQNAHINININGSQLPSDVPPQVVDNHTLAPMRVIFEALGANVDWDPETGLINGHKGSTDIQFEIGSMTANVNGEEVQLDVPLMIIDGRALVPVRFLSETLGWDVEWDAENNSVEITDDEEDEDSDDEDEDTDEDEDEDEDENEDDVGGPSHSHYNGHEHYNAHDNGNNYHENYNYHENVNIHENGEHYHYTYNFHYNYNEHYNNNGDEDDDDGDVVSGATVEITDLYSEGVAGSEEDPLTIYVEGTVENAPEEYALLVKVDFDEDNSIMLWDEYTDDGDFSLAYELEPGQDELLPESADDLDDLDVNAVIIAPDTTPQLKLLAIAECAYEDEDGDDMIAYNIIVKNGADYDITTRHEDNNGDPVYEAEQEGMDDGEILSGFYLTSEYELDQLKFYDDGTLFRTYDQTRINAVTNELP